MTGSPREGVSIVEIHSERAAIVDDHLLNGPPQVVQPGVPLAVLPEAVVGRETVLTSHTARFEPASIVAAIVAIGLLLLGGITVARAGLDGSLDEPVVTVAGFTATALLGAIEIAFGLLLLAAALSQARRMILFLGIVGGVVALIATFQTSLGHGSLAIERGFAIIAAIIMAVVVLAALLPTVQRRSVVRRTNNMV